MINIDEENKDLWLAMSEDERKRAEELVWRLELVLDYMTTGHEVSQEQMPELIDEVMGYKSVDILRNIQIAMGAHATKAAVMAAQQKYAKKQALQRKNAVNGAVTYEVQDEEILRCAEKITMYLHSDNGLMRGVVRECIANSEFALLKIFSDHILKDRENDWEGYGELLKEIEQIALQNLCRKKATRKVTRETFRTALIKLFEVKDIDGKPLFSKNNHWVAVMRVAIDVELVADNAPEAFVRFIDSLELPSMPKPLTRKTVGNSYNGIYTKPLSEWTDENYELKMNEDGAGRKSYFIQMRAVAQKLEEIVSYLCQRHK